jgi:hypothetical protein
MVRGVAASARPFRQRGHAHGSGRQARRGKVARRRRSLAGQQVVAQLLQGVNRLRRPATPARAGVAPQPCLGQGKAQARGSARCNCRASSGRPPAARSRSVRASGGHALPATSQAGLGCVRPGHGVVEAAAADRGQQLVGRLAGQHKAQDIAGGSSSVLSKRIGRHVVHALGRVDQHGLAAATRWCAGQTPRRRAWPRPGSPCWACASSRRARSGLFPTTASRVQA